MDGPVRVRGIKDKVDLMMDWIGLVECEADGWKEGSDEISRVWYGKVMND